MKKIKGTRIDSVAITELVAVPVAEESSLKVIIALHDMKANQSLAHAQFSDVWSEDTYRALRHLYDSVEKDVVRHISSGGEVSEADTDGTGTKGGLFEQG